MWKIESSKDGVCQAVLNHHKQEAGLGCKLVERVTVEVEVTLRRETRKDTQGIT